MKILITSYKNPDLDGVACAYAYTEFLYATYKDVVGAISGSPHMEAQFVLDKFNIPSLENAEKIINNIERIILVDTSDIKSLSDQIQSHKVIEIIDHRKVNEANKFPNARIQIDLVGAASTLIAEKFYNSQVRISPESAALLFSAIISNTINFKANTTTPRDKKMANWLKTKFPLPKNYVKEMFIYKSKFKKNLRETITDEFVIFNFKGLSLGIAQLEIINVDEFTKFNIIEIKKILKDLKKEKSLDFIFLTCIDLEKAFNTIIIIDEGTSNLLSQILKMNFENGIARRNGIIMRKEITPLIQDLDDGIKLFYRE
jgi:manganese-dependent inorganic pyrophosphatase